MRHFKSPTDIKAVELSKRIGMDTAILPSEATISKKQDNDGIEEADDVFEESTKKDQIDESKISKGKQSHPIFILG